MAASKGAKPPIQLAGIASGGLSNGGDRVGFTFEDQAGKQYTFTCPHEAIPDIVGVLFGLADQAQSAREGGAENVPLQTRYMRRVTALELAWSNDAVVMTLLCGTLPQRFVLTKQEWEQLTEAIESRPVQPSQATH